MRVRTYSHMSATTVQIAYAYATRVGDDVSSHTDTDAAQRTRGTVTTSGVRQRVRVR
jgi:hypothetical protein